MAENWVAQEARELEVDMGVFLLEGSEDVFGFEEKASELFFVSAIEVALLFDLLELFCIQRAHAQNRWNDSQNWR